MAAVLDCSGRKVCRWLGLNRSTLRYRPRPVAQKKRLPEEAIVKVSRKYPTEGYKKIAGQLRAREGFFVEQFETFVVIKAKMAHGRIL